MLLELQNRLLPENKLAGRHQVCNLISRHLFVLTFLTFLTFLWCRSIVPGVLLDKPGRGVGYRSACSRPRCHQLAPGTYDDDNDARGALITEERCVKAIVLDPHGREAWGAAILLLDTVAPLHRQPPLASHESKIKITLSTSNRH